MNTEIRNLIFGVIAAAVVAVPTASFVAGHRDEALNAATADIVKLKASAEITSSHESRIAKLETGQETQAKALVDINVTLGRIDERLKALVEYLGKPPVAPGHRS